MFNNNNYNQVNLPESVQVEETIEEESVRKFESDYRFATNDDICQVTKAQIAKLEAELHRMRILFIANGENPNQRVSEVATLGQEIARLEEVIDRLASYFENVL